MSDVERRDVLIGTLGLTTAALAATTPAAAGDASFMNNVPDPLLSGDERLREAVRLMMNHKGKSAFEILRSPDDLKLRSCLTLFREAASDNSDHLLFTEALDQFYRGQADDRTLELLAGGGR